MKFLAWLSNKEIREIITWFMGIIVVLVGAAWTLFKVYGPKPPDPKVEPHLKIRSLRYQDLKSINLVNSGLGPAVIVDAKFCRKESCTTNLVDLFEITSSWDTFVNISAGTRIAPGEQKTLVKLSLPNLLATGMSQSEGLEVLKQWQSEKTGIKVRVEYRDINGHVHGPLVTTLK